MEVQIHSIHGTHQQQVSLLLDQTAAAATLIDEARLRGAASTTEEANENIQMSADLKYILISITSGSAAMICRQYQQATGFEIWRQLHVRFMIPTGTRGIGYLTRLLKPTFDQHNFEESFTQWEYEVNRFETDNQSPLPDTVKVAILLNETKGSLQQHLQLEAGTNPTYTHIRTTIMEYYKSITAFSRMQQATSAQATYQGGGGAAPMDIGAINKGKGKGYKGKSNKGKSKQNKGYNDSKGKGNGNYNKGGFGKSKGKIQMQQKGWQQQPIGQGNPFSKGYAQAPHKGNKGKGKGKPVTAICYKCGNPGHMARDCRVAVYNMGEATYEDQTQAWWNDQQYDATWWSQDLRHVQQPQSQQQLALPPAPTYPVAQANTEQIHFISGVGNDLLIAAIGHQQVSKTQSTADSSRAHLMIDSGAATHVCPTWFAPASPMHPLSNEQGPRLRSVTNDNIQLFGYKWVYMQNNNGQSIVIPFCVCNVHQPILSVTRLAEQGFTLQFGDNPHIEHSKGFRSTLEQKDSLYCLNTKILQLPEDHKLHIESHLMVQQSFLEADRTIGHTTVRVTWCVSTRFHARHFFNQNGHVLRQQHNLKTLGEQLYDEKTATMRTSGTTTSPSTSISNDVSSRDNPGQVRPGSSHTTSNIKACSHREQRKVSRKRKEGNNTASGITNTPTA